MNLLAAPVLGGAVLVSAPAFWGVFVDGTTTIETAVVRFLVSATLCWMALAVFEMLVGPPPRHTDGGTDPGSTAARDADSTG